MKQRDQMGEFFRNSGSRNVLHQLFEGVVLLKLNPGLSDQIEDADAAIDQLDSDSFWLFAIIFAILFLTETRAVCQILRIADHFFFRVFVADGATT